MFSTFCFFCLGFLLLISFCSPRSIKNATTPTHKIDFKYHQKKNNENAFHNNRTIILSSPLVSATTLDFGPSEKMWLCWTEYYMQKTNNIEIKFVVKVSGMAVNTCIKIYSTDGSGTFESAYTITQINDLPTHAKYTYFSNPECTSQRKVVYQRTFEYISYYYRINERYMYMSSSDMFFATTDNIPIPKRVNFAVNLTFDHYFPCNTTSDMSQAIRFAAYRQNYCVYEYGPLVHNEIIVYGQSTSFWYRLPLRDRYKYTDCNSAYERGPPSRFTNFYIHSETMLLGTCVTPDWKGVLEIEKPPTNHTLPNPPTDPYYYTSDYDETSSEPEVPMLDVDTYVELPEHRQLYMKWTEMYIDGPTMPPKVAPTRMPSIAPSVGPSREPSTEPSVEPTTKPSPAPTTTPAPSHTPGSDRNTYNFNVEQILVGISSLTYASQYTLHNSIVRDTIGAVLNIPPIWVTILTVSTLSPININLLSFVRYFTPLALTDRCLVKYKVQFNTTAMNNKQYIDKPELVYNNLTAFLIDSINNSTQFTDILHYKAEQQGVTVFDEVTSDVPKTTAFKPDYVYIDGTSSKKPSRDTLIWSIFCSVLVSVCWLYLGVHYCRKYYLKRRENRAVVPIREDMELTEHCSNDNSIAASDSGNSINADNVSVRSGAAVYEQAILIDNDNYFHNNRDDNNSTRIEIINNVHNTEQSTHSTSTPVSPFEVIDIVTNDSKNTVSEQKIDEHEEKVDFSDEEKPDFGVKVKPTSQSKSTTLRLKPKSTPAAQHKYAVAVSNNEDEMIDIETQDFDNYIV